MSSRAISLSKRIRVIRESQLRRSTLPSGMDQCPGYQLRECRGRGGFGEVWEASTATGERVALKLIRCDGAAAPRELRNLQQVRQITHPYLLHVDKVFCYSGYLVLVMDLAEGSLQEWLEVSLNEGQKLPRPDRICHYLSQIAEALDFLNTRQHRIGGQLVAFRHCDVKPSNMLLFGSTAMLADFGLAVKTGAAGQRRSLGGSTHFAPPEVFSGSLSERTDQYSLAASYFHLRTGRLPFPDSPPQLQRDYIRPIPDLSSLPARECLILGRALSPSSMDRWPSCRELMSQLSAAVRQ